MVANLMISNRLEVMVSKLDVPLLFWFLRVNDYIILVFIINF